MSFLEGLFWLSLNVYHEARGEPQIGQLAVAHVTLNRAVQQNQSVENVVTAPYQFSWTFQKKSYFPEEPGAFIDCVDAAFQAMISSDFTQGATYYHRQDIRPKWAQKMKYLNQYGAHKFYRDL